MKDRDLRPLAGDSLTSRNQAMRLLRDAADGRIDRREFARRAAIVGLGVPSVATLISACGGDDSTPGADPGGSTGGSNVELPRTVVVAQTGPVVGLDPDGPGDVSQPSQTVFLACYDGLTVYEWPLTEDAAAEQLANGVASQAKPRLAESWESALGGKAYRFKLRENVVSPFGNTMTADDVVWSARKAFAAEGNGAFVLSFIGKVPDAESVRKIDDMTVEFRLSEQSDWLLIALGFYIGGGLMVHDSTEVGKHATGKDEYGQKWLASHTAGYGPYTIVEGDLGGSYTLEARDDYWGEERALERVVQRSIPEPGSRLQLVLTDEAVITWGLDPGQLDKVDASENATVTHVDSTGAVFLPLTDEGVWGDPEVRQAIAKAIPYEAILQKTLRGRAKPYQSLLLPFLPGFTDEYAYQEDIEAAKAVLSQVKEPLTLVYAAAESTMEQIALLIQTNMRNAGFDLQVQKQPQAEFDTKRFAGGNAFWLDQLATPGVASVTYYFQLYTGDPATVGFYNFFGYSNPEMDAEVEKMFGEDQDEVLAATRKGQEIFMRDLPMIPVAWTGLDVAHSRALAVPYAYSGNGVVEWRDLVRA